MTKEEQAIAVILKQGIVPLFYHDNTSICLGAARALYTAGIRCIEFTNRGSMAEENFIQLVALRDLEMPDLLLAAGTITTDQQANRFMAAGADIFISPVFDEGVLDVAYANKRLWIPGCMTPTDIHIAARAGCKMIKLFPGEVLGPQFVKAIRPLFPEIRFLVTGGIHPDKKNLQEWLEAGANCVGMGSKLLTQELLANAAYATLQKNTQDLLSIMAALQAAKN